MRVSGLAAAVADHFCLTVLALQHVQPVQMAAAWWACSVAGQEPPAAALGVALAASAVAPPALHIHAHPWTMHMFQIISFP